MKNQVMTNRKTGKYQLKETIYAVGITPENSPKDKIARLHGKNSDVATAVEELEKFITAPEFKQNQRYLRFFWRLKRIMGILNHRANGYIKYQMAQNYIDELINEGYLRCLHTLALPCGKKHVDFARSYAKSHDISLGSALLFGPNSGTRQALRYFMLAERSHGKHRPSAVTEAMTPDTRQQWFNAGNTYNWPASTDKTGNEEPMNLALEEGNIQNGTESTVQKLWQRNESFRGYKGTNRLSGDIPFKILEAAVDIIMRGPYVPAAITQRYDRIIQSANHDGVEPFYAVYQNMFSDSNKLKEYWDKAREMLYQYSIKLWQQENHDRLANGQRIPPEGVTCRVEEPVHRPKKKIPGTIYLNNNRYYWIVGGKMKAVPLIDPATAPKFPGTIFKDGNRYYWLIARFLKRQKLVPEGEKFSTKEKATAEKIALEKWKQIQKDKPAFAAQVLRHTRSKGLATKDRKLAEEIALKMWRDIQKNDPELAAKILTDNRPEASEHWHAQIKTDNKVRFIGSFKSKKEAQEAYRQEFEKYHGYPVGYNVQSIPKIDKVWPTWQEQKTRLKGMDFKPVMPVIGLSEKAESLVPMLDRMQKVDWLAKSCMVVLDDNAPCATMDMAIQSRGQLWYGEMKKQGVSIYGSTSFDKSSKRIRITLFNPAFDDRCILAEEVYHLIYRIIGKTKPEIAGQVQRWYEKKVHVDLDPSVSEDEAFAQTMAHEDVADVKSDLPRTVVKHAKRLFSPSCRLKASTCQEIMA